MWTCWSYSGCLLEGIGGLKRHLLVEKTSIGDVGFGTSEKDPFVQAPKFAKSTSLLFLAKIQL
jgi:hypothetical protein